jgi:hypothetical protein
VTGDGSLSQNLSSLKEARKASFAGFRASFLTADNVTENRPNVIQIAKSDFLVYDIELDKTQTNMTSSRVYG